MRVIDEIKSIIVLIVFGGFFYIIWISLTSEYEKRQKCFRVEFNSGAVYWADSVHVISENQVSFFDVYRKRNVKMYGQFTISTPKNKD